MTTLLICEKPDAAKRIAEALSDEKLNSQTRYGMPYYNIVHSNERLIVCPALGHLYSISARTKSKANSYPVWDFEWKPKHLIERGQKRIEYWIKAISELSKQAEEFVNGCDYDVEGSLIGYMILKCACDGADSKARRMKFSTLTKNELRSAYSNLASSLDFNVASAGMCRHEVDWLYGINLSRALTASANRYGGGYFALSTGRVQGPTLRFIVQREKEIQKFIPLPYWTIDAGAELGGKEIPTEYSIQRILNLGSAKRVVDDCLGKSGTVTDLKTAEARLDPPHPFDLSNLQSETYRLFGISPRETLAISERLYLDAVISYPRTSSQKLPPSIGYGETLTALARSPSYTRNCRRLLASATLKPFEGQRTDPAHPAIYPTGTISRAKLDGRSQRIFDLIVKRFMATFAPPAKRRSDRVTITIQNHSFYIRGSRTIDPGWIEYYTPYARFEEIELPPVSLGQNVLLKRVSAIQRFTQPPPRYNPSSLLRLMEEQRIGTKATRAEIVETLFRRGYVKDERIVASEIAFDIIDLMLKFCPRIVDVSFTRELEDRMEQIEIGTIGREQVVKEAVEALKPAIEELKANEASFGKWLNRSIRLAAISDNMLSTPCPGCGSRLYIQKSRVTGKRFIACSDTNTHACKFTLPLPQLGRLTLIDKKCPKCSFQMVRISGRNAKSFESCSMCYVANQYGGDRERKTSLPEGQSSTRASDKT